MKNKKIITIVMIVLISIIGIVTYISITKEKVNKPVMASDLNNVRVHSSK